MNYITRCNLIIENSDKGDELYNYLATKIGDNIDHRRGYLEIYEAAPGEFGNLALAKYIQFYACFKSQAEREEIFNKFYEYKPLCSNGPLAAYQTIEKFDTGGATFGSPLYNIVMDHWGADV